VLNNRKDNLGKFDAKSNEGIFLGYSLNSKVFRIYNKRNMIIEESIHVVFDGTNPIRPRNEKGNKGKGNGNEEDFQIDENKTNIDLPREWRTSRYHPPDNIIGDISKGNSLKICKMNLKCP